MPPLINPYWTNSTHPIYIDSSAYPYIEMTIIKSDGELKI